jgi:hypothetical protein
MQKRIFRGSIMGLTAFILLVATLLPFRINLTITWDTVLAQGDAETPPANAERRIAYGETAYNEVTSDAPVVTYSFEGQAGDIVSITMIRGECGRDFDPFVALQSPDGIRLAEDDNTGPDRSAKIIAYELPKTGTYTILATRSGGADGRSTGDFHLFLDTVNPVPLELGTTASTNLATNRIPQVFELNLAADSLVRIGANSTVSGIDPYLVILDPFGAVIATDDDSAERRMPEIDPFIVPVTGIYRVAVFAKEAIGGAAEVYAETTRAVPVQLGETVNFTLSPETRRGIFLYQGRTDELLSFRVRRTIATFRPNVSVYRGIPLDGNRIASVRGAQLATAYMEVNLNTDGYYVIVVQRQDAEFGSFEIVFERAQ